MAKVRQFVPWILAAFFVYAVVTSPDKSADTVRNVWDIVQQGFGNIGDFFGNLLGG